jgi:ATP-dependent DNA helicase 2 subunit 1
MASHVFAGSRTRLGEKRVFLFTNQEDPHKDDANLRRKALTKAADLKVYSRIRQMKE